MNFGRAECKLVEVPYEIVGPDATVDLSLDLGVTWVTATLVSDMARLLMAGPAWVAAEGDPEPDVTLVLGKNRILGRIQYGDSPAITDWAEDAIYCA